MLTLLSKINDGEYDKYHVYDSFAVYLQMAMKGVGGCVFGVGVVRFYFVYVNTNANGNGNGGTTGTADQRKNIPKNPKTKNPNLL
jgi:hypothetical protein